MPISSIEKCKKLASRIITHLQAGITLDEDTCHYIESTFSALSFSDLVTLIRFESDLEAATLIELIFYPTLSLQMDLEPMIEKTSFDAANEKYLVDLLVNAAPSTILYSPSHGEKADLTIPRAAFSPLISRLNITRKLPGNLIEAIHQSSPPANQNQIKVHIRNRRFNHLSSHIKFLVRFLGDTDPKAKLFHDSFCFVLDLLSEQKHEVDFLMVLEDKMRLYHKLHRNALRFDEQLTQHNMETLMFQGIRAPQISQTEAEKRIALIEYIKKAVLGEEAI